MQRRSSALPVAFAWKLVIALAVCLGFAISLPGCGGCRKETAAQKKKREEDEQKKAEELKKKKAAEKPKPNFERLLTQVLPNLPPPPPDVKDLDGKESKVEDVPGKKTSPAGPGRMNYVKPGHWTMALQTAKANNFEFPGTLRTFPEDNKARNEPLTVRGTNYRLSMHRPASLPKGQLKSFETLYYLPVREDRKPYSLITELTSARGGGGGELGNAIATLLDPHEYFIVVLARNSNSYVDLERRATVKMSNSDIGSGPKRHYHVILPGANARPPLPGHSLAWTMIAYLLWDDFDPDALNKDQQQALLDWLHWGGQLIVSGPNSLNTLKKSFLAEYLPVDAGEDRKLEAPALKELNAYWSLPSTTAPAISHELQNIGANKPILGVELKLRAGGEFLPHTGDLVAERRVGGGRIVVSSFPLSDVYLRNWESYDCFLNGCLLRRPAREFSATDDGELRFYWRDSAIHDAGFTFDPRLNTGLRYFSRDIGYMALADLDPQSAERENKLREAERLREQSKMVQDRMARLNMPSGPDEERVRTTYAVHPNTDDWHFAGYHAAPQSGLGGWNDSGAVSEGARDSLREAGGIKIPQADFVITVLAVYLLILAPLNWFVFWLLGRVEWAWAAAPLIAIVGAIAVIRLAQLDIGFARSRTEVAVLEIQADYPRAHVTRFTSLYTSLSTSYRLSFDDPSALSLPFPASPKDDPAGRQLQAFHHAEFRRDKETTLAGVQISSNSAGMVHSEHMLTLDGPLSFSGDAAKGYRLKNDAQFVLRDAAVLRKRLDGRLEAAYVAELKPSTSCELTFAPVLDDPQLVSGWSRSVVMSRTAPLAEEDQGRVRLYRLVELATRRLRFLPGDVRLVAWTNDPLPGMKVSPESAQVVSQSLVLAHLARGPLPPPQHDSNNSLDYKRKDTLTDEMPAEETPAIE